MALDEPTNESCLAGSNLTGQQDEAALLANSVRQMIERLSVSRTQIEKGRIRHQLKGMTVKVEKGTIHCCPLSSMALGIPFHDSTASGWP